MRLGAFYFLYFFYTPFALNFLNFEIRNKLIFKVYILATLYSPIENDIMSQYLIILSFWVTSFIHLLHTDFTIMVVILRVCLPPVKKTTNQQQHKTKTKPTNQL